MRPLRRVAALAASAALAAACAAPPGPPRRAPEPARRTAVKKPPPPPPRKPAGPGPVTATSWRTHPSIEAVRRLVAEHEAAIGRSRWPRTDSQVCAPGASADGFGLDRAVWLDERSRIRKYVVGESTDEVAYKLEHHYDEGGRLRYALGTAGAMNGASTRVAIWYADDGGVLWLDRTRAGAAWPFPEGWPERAVVRDPARDFVRPGPKGCVR